MTADWQRRADITQFAAQLLRERDALREELSSLQESLEHTAAERNELDRILTSDTRAVELENAALQRQLDGIRPVIAREAMWSHSPNRAWAANLLAELDRLAAQEAQK